MVVKPNQEMLYTALSTAIGLHYMNFSKVIFKLRIKQTILGSFEYFGNEITIFL